MDNYLPNLHPGEILRLEFLESLDISPAQLSQDINAPQPQVGDIISEHSSITADIALRLSKYFGNSAQFWMNLQTQYDLRRAQITHNKAYDRISAFPQPSTGEI